MANRSWRTSLKLEHTGGAEIPIPSGADLGIRQSFQLVPGGSARRSANGDMIVLPNTSRRKYRTDISGADHLPPAISGLFENDLITVYSISKLPQAPSSSTQTTLSRRPVEGSVFAVDAAGNDVPVSVNGKIVTHSADAAVVFFRPILDCVLLSLSSDEEEISKDVYWSMTFEEV